MKFGYVLTVIAICFFSVDCTSSTSGTELRKASETLTRILELYDAGHGNLFNETYPYQEENKVTYLAGEDNAEGKRVAYLWPTSGVFSGVISLYKNSRNEEYYDLLNKKLIPGLENYFDSKREPVCYQSYITRAGESDRFYDDNIWLAIDFCELYQLTGEQQFLEKSVQLWDFIQSGRDEKLGGGIYWCEQKKASKNTCSNAPAAVLALKLYEATADRKYFQKGLQIYEWTKSRLQDPTDHLYFDNIKLSGEIDSVKYTYNSGQMLQAASLLYKITGEQKYLKEAQKIAASAIQYFTSDFTTPEGKKIHLFKNTGNWFNTVLFRGYEELFYLDKNPEYIHIFRDNLAYLWEHVRDKNGLFGKDWTGEKQARHKWLLDQASLVELWARISNFEENK